VRPQYWLTVATLAAALMPATLGARQDQKPTFHSSVNLVAVTAVVRKPNGQPVTNLKSGDFELFDDGEKRAITEFQPSQAPVSLALLLDDSGSMDVGEKRAAAHDTTASLVSALQPGVDEIGLFTFDSQLHELEPLKPAPGAVLQRLSAARPFGATSLYDAIAGAGRSLADRGAAHRALIALTDGADNASRLTPAQVSAMASAIDVPVYVFVVVSPFDKFGNKVVDQEGLDNAIHGPLGDLARMTGGDIIRTVTPEESTAGAQRIVAELRHQYLIAFPPGGKPGWHSIDLRTRQRNLVVRARNGYVVPGRPS
jgi:Ca-activated chloride channel family protein